MTNDSTGLCYYERMSKRPQTSRNVPQAKWMGQEGGSDALLLAEKAQHHQNHPPIFIPALTPQALAALVEESVSRLTCTLRPDYLAALHTAAATEADERGRKVLEQLITNAHIAAEEKVPLCQDTGYVWVCLEVSGDICVPANIFSSVDAAVARAAEASGMRMSMLGDALVERVNTGNNTPAFCEVLVRQRCQGDGSFDTPTPTPPPDTYPGAPTCPPNACPDAPGARLTNAHPDTPADTLDVPTSATLHVMLKGGGSDNASALAMLPPGAGIQGVMDFVVDAVAAKGANACPPLLVGVGVGGSFDKVGSLAKHALLRQIGSTHTNGESAALEADLLSRINALGIGPGGLGGTTTALAVHVESAPCHIAALPVAVNLGCTALRSESISLSCSH